MSRWLSEAARSLTSTSPAAIGVGHLLDLQRPRGRRPRGCGRRSRARSSHDGRRAAERLPTSWGSTSWAQRPSHRMRRRRGTSPSAVREGCSARCGSRWRGRRYRVIPRRCSTASARSCRRRSATTRPLQDAARDGCRATPGSTTTRCSASVSTLSAAASAGAYRVLVDANQHVDRDGARRAGVGFYGRNTMLITRRHGSWVVLGRSSPRRRSSQTSPVAPGCGRCRLCIDACPTGALDEPAGARRDALPLVLDANGGGDPYDVMEARDRVYGCDICQDSLPLERGVEKRRAARRSTRRRGRRLARRLADPDDEELVDGARPAVRPGQRRTLAPPERARRRRQRRLGGGCPLVAPFLDDEDPVLSAVAGRAAGRIEERM